MEEIRMDPPSINASADSVETPSSASRQFARSIKRKVTNFSFIGYSAGFLFAAVLSLGLVGFCCWLIYLDFKTGAEFSISGWAQSVITFIMGAWITDRPKFFKDKKKE